LLRWLAPIARDEITPPIRTNGILPIGLSSRSIATPVASTQLIRKSNRGTLFVRGSLIVKEKKSSFSSLFTFND
jgi:hypothetical protein